MEDTDFKWETIRQLQIQDLQGIAAKAERGTVSFKPLPNTTTTMEDSKEREPSPADRRGAGGGLYFYHPDHLGTGTFLTDANGLPYEFFLNLPFGETMIEQHSLTEDYENLWKFTGHELDKETGMYYAGARFYNPKWSIFISVDPMAEQAPGWTPYRYGFNNPVRYTDPTGMFEEDWKPVVNDDGSTSYIAEKGDSASTLASQYGISQRTAEAITGTTGNEEIAEGTEVSGEKVKEVTGSEVLKLDLNSRMATEQRVFDQYLFARDHSSLNGNFGFYTTEYFGNVFSQPFRMMEGFANLNVGDRNIQVKYRLPLYETRGTFYNVTKYSYFLNNSMVTDKMNYGNEFGRIQALNHTHFPLYLSFDKGKSNLMRQGTYTITTPNENISLMRKKFRN